MMLVPKFSYNFVRIQLQLGVQQVSLSKTGEKGESTKHQVSQSS